jgi:hypothetical protein
VDERHATVDRTPSRPSRLIKTTARPRVARLSACWLALGLADQRLVKQISAAWMATTTTCRSHPGQQEGYGLGISQKVRTERAGVGVNGSPPCGCAQL